MEWELAKFLAQMAVAAGGAYAGVRVALATLAAKVASLEKSRDEDLANISKNRDDDRRDHRALETIVYEHGDRIAVVESKIGIRYRSE